MAFTLADRVRETSTTTGTGAYALSGAVAGFRAFSTAIGSNQCTYVATMGSQYEVGVGTLAGSVLSRTLILASSNGGAAVNWSAGTKEIRCDITGAVAMQMYHGAVRWGTTLGGSANAMTTTVSPAIYSYWPGLSIVATTSQAFTGSAATLNVNGIGAAEVRRWNNASLSGISIGSNALVNFCYDGTLFRIVQIDTAGGGASGVSSIFGRTGSVVAQSGDYTPAQILPSLSGNALELLRVNSGATGVEWAPVSAAGQVHSRQQFTSSGVYTKPPGLIAALIRCQAPGGGSGGIAATGANEGAASPGGGGGEYREGWFAASVIAATVTVTIGARGSGGVGFNSGGDGGLVSFGTLITAQGGRGSVGGAASSTNPGSNGGPGGTGGAGGTLVIVGGQGGASKLVGGAAVPTNNGGSSFMGQGAAARINAAGEPGNNYGGGASGCTSGANESSRSGALGGGGICIIEEVL